MSTAAVRFRQHPGVLSRVLGGSVLVRADGTTHEVLGAAVTAWLLLDAPRTQTELIELLASRYEVMASSIQDEVARMLDDLLARRVIEEVVDADI